MSNAVVGNIRVERLPHENPSQNRNSNRFIEEPTVSEQQAAEPTAFEQAITGVNPEEIDAQTPQQEIQPVAETTRDTSLRLLRERADTERKRAEAAERRAKELEERFATGPRQEPNQQNSRQLAFKPFDKDDYPSGDQINERLNELAQNYETKLSNLERKQNAASATQTLKAVFPDFDQVVNDENIQNFAAAYPEEYMSMISNPDIYGAGKTAYTFIKNVVGRDTAYTQAPVAKLNYQAQAARVQQNIARPRTAASTSPQVGNLNVNTAQDGRRRLTEDYKASIRSRYGM